jgi:hypothetical protein
MRMSVITNEVSQPLEDEENRRQANEWKRKLMAKAESYDGEGFRELTEQMITWGLNDPANREVVKLVIHDVGKQVPEITLTLAGILARRRN